MFTSVPTEFVSNGICIAVQTCVDTTFATGLQLPTISAQCEYAIPSCRSSSTAEGFEPSTRKELAATFEQPVRENEMPQSAQGGW